MGAPLVLRYTYSAGWHGLVLQAVEAARRFLRMPTAWSTRPCHPTRHSTSHKSPAGLRYAVCFTICGLSFLTSASAIQSQSPEDQRLDPDEFREGLRRRGLTELLQLHLNESPPDDPVQSMLLEREVKLGRYRDPTLPESARRNALMAANRLLRSLITDHPDQSDAFDWRLQLGKSLLYDEAEPYCLNVLYRGGTQEDRSRLALLMDDALTIFDDLLERLAKELDRVDELPLREFERLERRGHIERIETTIPQAQYMRRWAIYYRALARRPSDPLRGQGLRAMLQDLVGRSELLTVSHDISHYQCQSMLLAGLASRLLGRAAEAAGYLGRSIAIGEAVSDPPERKQLQWAITLARVERVRALADAAEFDRALQAVDEFATGLESSASGGFGLRLTAGLLSCEVRQRYADRLVVRGLPARADRMRGEAWHGLQRLAAEDTAYRNAIYATLSARIGPDADPADLHPFEQCAVLAGWLARAESIGEQIKQLDGRSPDVGTDREALGGERLAALDHAIDAGQAMWQQPVDPDATDLHSEIGYNLGVALYLRGQRSEAVGQFLALLDRHGPSKHGLTASTFAVQIADELYRDPSGRTRSDVQRLYLRALEALLARFPVADEAKYWRFFYAQTLDELGRHDQAAEQFQRIRPGHEHYVSTVYLYTRAVSNSLNRYAAEHPDKITELARRAGTVARAGQRFEELVAHRGIQGESGVDRLLAHAVLMVAEAHVIPGVGLAKQALEGVADFEQRFSSLADLIGRALRVRVLAYAALGRVDDARSVVPRFLQRLPDRAVPTLQSLFDRMNDDAVAARATGREQDADGHAEMALLLAEELMEWANLPTSDAPPATLYALRLQLAEARVQVGRFAEARMLFEQCMAEDSSGHPDGQARDLRVVYGLGEALYGLDEFSDALDLFARIFQESSVKDRRWWHALLRNLQCRTELGHEAAGIISAIQQQRFLHPRMGGDHLRGQFEALLEHHEAKLLATPSK